MQRAVIEQQHAYDTPLLPIDEAREQAAREKMTQPPYNLDAAARDVVCQAVIAISAERGWNLWAVHVRSNHVHVVIQAEREPGRIMSDLKARASRDLTCAGYDTADRRRWTRHGSTKHLFHEEDVAAKIRYTLDEQGPRMAWSAKEPRTK